MKAFFFHLSLHISSSISLDLQLGLSNASNWALSINLLVQFYQLFLITLKKKVNILTLVLILHVS